MGSGALVFSENPTITDAELINPVITGALFPADQAQASNYAVDTGLAANTYIAAFTPALTAYPNGMPLRILALHSNTGPSTLDAGDGPLPIYRRNSTSLIGNEIIAGQPFEVLTFSDHFQLLSITPATDVAAFAGTDTQSAITPAQLTAIAIVIDPSGDVHLPRDLYVARDLFVGRNGAFVGTVDVARLNIASTFTTVSGATTTNTMLVSASGNVDGTTDIRGFVLNNTFNGAAGGTNSTVVNIQSQVSHTAGTMTLAIGLDAWARLGVLSSSNGNLTNAYAIRAHVANESLTGNIDRAYSLYVQEIDLADGAGLVNYAHGVHVRQQQGPPPLTPGRVRLEAIGVYVEDMNHGAALTAAYFSHMHNNSSDQVLYPKYALYFDGTASSIHNGALNIGDVTDPTLTALLQVRRSVEGSVQGAYFGYNGLLNAQGHVDGTGDLRGIRQAVTWIGTNNIAEVDALSAAVVLSATAATVTTVYGLSATLQLNSTGNVTTMTGVHGGLFHNGDGVTTTANAFQAGLTFQGGTGTVGAITGLAVGNIGGVRVTGSAVGVDIGAASVITGGGLNASIRTQNAAGTNKFNIYAIGSAANILTGPTNIGDITTPTNITLRIASVLGAMGATATVIGTSGVATMTANADGLSDFRMIKSMLAPTGANNYAMLMLGDHQMELGATAGTIAAAHGIHAYVRNNGDAAITLSRVFSGQVFVNGNGVVTAATAYYAKLNFSAGTGTVVTSRGIHVDDVGGARVSSVAIGIDIENPSGITGGGINANIRLNATAATARWALYAPGGASSAHSGSLSLGQTTAPAARLDVLANIPTAAAGQSIGGIQSIAALSAADAGGTTDYRNFKQVISLAGANSAVNFVAHEIQEEINHTAGTLTTAFGTETYVRLGGAGAITTLRGNRTRILINGAGVVTAATGLTTGVTFQGSTGTVTTSRGIHINDVGGARVTSEAVSIEIDALSSITGGGITAAIRSSVSTGTNRWFLYNASTGPSNFAASYLQFSEMTAPSAPAADQVRLYSQDNGGGKTQLMALFSSGAAQQIAIQP
jgi:hypothetical protein